MPNHWIVMLLSLAAALAFAMSSSLKHVSAGGVPDAQSLHPNKLGRFVRATMAHPLWLAGLGCDVFGLALQIAALHLGTLTVVQPLLLSSLLFALLIRGWFDRRGLTRQKLAWAVVLSVALVGFVLLAAPSSKPGPDLPEPGPAVITGVLGAVLVALCVELGRRQRNRRWGAALLGTAVGIIYTATAAMLKSATNIAVDHLPALFASWQLYTLIALGAAGLLLSQLTFQAGPLAASLPATATVDPLLSILVGIVVYREHIRAGLGAGLELILLLVILVIAVVQLSRIGDDPVRRSAVTYSPKPNGVVAPDS